jgi:acetylornithine deacetylase
MRSVDLLRELVAFDTTSRNSNLALVRWACAQLEAAGARIRLTHDDSGEKANVLASFGPEAPGGLLLSAHTDTVPVDGQVWTSDPFTLIERDGRLYARGTSDMKGFVACCLAAAADWGRTPLARPIHLALTYDEEVGCFGVPRLIADLLAHVPKPALAIVGEPTLMRVADCHRGFLGFHTTFRGRAAHSSDPAKGVSAIAAAARLVALIEEQNRREAAGVKRTTFNVGRISGGTNINVVPSHCEVLWEIRPAADADVAGLRDAAAALVARAAKETSTETRDIVSVPPLRPQSHNPAIDFAQAMGAALPASAVAFGTEAGFFQAAGIPTVICGPGSIEQAHQPDEWISLDQFGAGARFLERVGEWARM